MKNNELLGVLLASVVVPAAGVNERPADETLGAFVGSWAMELVADAETFGERGGAGAGTMDCAWGPLESWVDCELDSHYRGLGRYVLKIVLYRTGKAGTYGAFVTNSLGGGRLYLGRWDSPDRLVYQDAWIDPRRKWEYQRTTYTFHDPDHLSYAIEVSTDGERYLPHSRGTYRRR